MILELVTFRLRAGVSEEQFIEAVRAVDTFLTDRAGFRARQVLRTEADGGWVDLVWWADLAAARSAADAIGQDPAAASFMACIDPASVQVSHSELTHARPEQPPW